MFTQLVSLIEKADDASPAPVAPSTTVVTVDKPTLLSNPVEASSVNQSATDLLNGDGTVNLRETEGFEATPVLGDDLPSPIPAIAPHGGCNTTSLLVPGDEQQVAHLVASLVAVESERDGLRRQVTFTQSQVELLQAKVEALETIIRRTAIDGDVIVEDEQKCEARALLQDSRDQSIEYLQRLAQHNVKVIEELSQELESERRRRMVLDLAVETHSKRSQSSETELATLRADLDACRNIASVAKKENARLSARAEALRLSIEAMEADARRRQAELDAAAGQILRRDTEIAFLKQNAAGPSSKDLRTEPIMNAMAKNKVGSKVVSAATMLDTIVVRLGRLLRGNAQLRLIAALYIIVLHVYVFNAIMMLLHHSSIMPDHTGSDVHDHIANHIHH